MKRPAFQFYPGDYLSDMAVSQMTAEEEGHYIRLLCHCWIEGSLPNDDGELGKLLKPNGGSCLVPTVVKARFVVVRNDPSKLVHKRLEKERQKQDAWVEKSRLGGKKSVQVRRNKGIATPTGGSLVVQPPFKPNANSSSSSSSSSSIPPTPLSKGGTVNFQEPKTKTPEPEPPVFRSQELRSQPRKCLHEGCAHPARIGLPGQAALFCSEACYSLAQKLDPTNFPPPEGNQP